MLMSVSLVEALGQVELEEGRVYRCQVKGQLVELRVLGPAGPMPASRFDEEDVMFDSWVEFPLPTPSACVIGQPGPQPAPDIPEIPQDEDGA